MIDPVASVVYQLKAGLDSEREKKPNFHMFGYSSYSQLSCVSADMLHCAGVVIAAEHGEFRHLELGRRRQLVELLRIRFGVTNQVALRGDAKLIIEETCQLLLEGVGGISSCKHGLVAENRPASICCLSIQ